MFKDKVIRKDTKTKTNIGEQNVNKVSCHCYWGSYSCLTISINVLFYYVKHPVLDFQLAGFGFVQKRIMLTLHLHKQYRRQSSSKCFLRQDVVNSYTKQFYYSTFL